MGEHSKALSFYEKTLEICVNSLSPNHPDLGWYHNNIGMVYDKMDNYSKAFCFYERALDIGQRALPESHPHLQLYRDNVERIKKKL
jgi:tetratricopeptide (TPR) repeat protein